MWDWKTRRYHDCKGVKYVLSYKRVASRVLGFRYKYQSRDRNHYLQHHK